MDKPAAQQSALAVQQETAVENGDTGAMRPSSYALRIYKDATRIKLRGQIPSEEDHKTVLGLVKAAFASIDITDRVKSGKEHPNANLKVGGMSFALKVLSFLETGNATVDETSVTLEGTASTRARYDEALKCINAGAPTGVVLKHNIATPKESIIDWHAEVSDKRLNMNGAITDKKVLYDGARELFRNFEIADDTRVVEGTPESWMRAALHSLQILSRLDHGGVKITDRSIRIEGVAADEAALHAIDALTDKYPSGYALETKISVVKQAGMLGIPQTTSAER